MCEDSAAGRNHGTKSNRRSVPHQFIIGFVARAVQSTRNIRLARPQKARSLLLRSSTHEVKIYNRLISLSIYPSTVIPGAPNPNGLFSIAAVMLDYNKIRIKLQNTVDRN